jgi:ferredoxin
MIFYFTGTGNSLYTARSLDDDIRSIPQVMKEKEMVYQADAIGIVCPIYGHEMPQMVKDFIHRAKLCTPYLYVILTYGNRHANAVELALKAFRENGYEPAYAATLLTVDNFLPAFDMNEQKSIDKKEDDQLERIRQDLKDRRHWLEPVSEEDRQAHQSYLKQVQGKDASIWADFKFTDACIGCGICTHVCPAGCIHLEGGRAVRTGENCQACFACIQACPLKAIEMNEVCGYTEINPYARYRNPHVTLSQLTAANHQRED